MRGKRNKRKSGIRVKVARRLHRKQKTRLNKGPIIVLSVAGFLALSLVIIGAIVAFVLRPAYDALMDFVDALGDSDYSFDFDEDEEDDEEEED